MLTEVLVSEWMHKSLGSREVKQSGTERVGKAARAELITGNFWWRCAWGDTPVPIPNTMVKTQAADGTALETVWESRWLPEYTINLLHELVVTRAIVRSTILNVRNAR